MKTKYIFVALMALTTLPSAAQETYENTKMVEDELNGTARYVGMGGAMDALGADISTLASNPAGIGLFRRSALNVSGSLVMQTNGEKFAGEGLTRASLDQLGFVYAVKNNSKSYINFAFNYHKSKNFAQILSASDKLENASQNKLTALKYAYGKELPAKHAELMWNAIDNLYSQALPYDSIADLFEYVSADYYSFNRSSKGYIGEYDFNISGNINNRVYLGLTVGLHQVHYQDYSEYMEHLVSGEDIVIADNRMITGAGADIKLGVIFRPVATSPFRIGLSVATPTWYDLTTEGQTGLYDARTGESFTEKTANSRYEFKLNTPWKFGLSLGHTVGSYLALGASYEYAAYQNMDTHVIEGYEYDYWYGDAYSVSNSDRAMNEHTQETLKGVSTLKLGLEYKPESELALRAGYNFLSPMYDMKGDKDGTLLSNGSCYASSTDYTNWKATNRFTLGAGYTVKNWNFDLAWQMTVKKGEFSPFIPYYGAADNSPHPDDNVADVVAVKHNRSQLLLSIGYRF